ncbi:FAD/NAD(P)-binding protein [Streptomyces sp. NPDC006458]|uniref:FAD/NAD(P)-binding protein n=1 Tax=Streptomyces sp. NPDC006458 TaxID=3154302 RepID=UPI0033BF6C75
MPSSEHADKGSSAPAHGQDPGADEAVPYRLVLVGGGPSATYVLERLSAEALHFGGAPLEIRVFECSGEFGAGLVHSWSQPTTSYLNRIAAQIGFAADESVTDAGPLRPAGLRPTLYEWCRARFAETGDPDLALGPTDWPKRYVHGLALREMFAAYVADLRGRQRTTVHLHQAEVADVRDDTAALSVRTTDGEEYSCDELLLLTGHSQNDPARSERSAVLADFARASGAHYVPYAYPLDTALPEKISGPGTVVACAGMGLTAIDEILHLTEGRGGRFETGPGGGLRYRPSGAEPDSIIAFSPTGVFTYARPHNDKERDPARLEHRGRFLTEQAVDRLRAVVGERVTHGGRTRKQLDFERHVLPLVLLEMAQVHYTTLFGPATGDFLAKRADPSYRAFLGAGPHTGAEGLLAPLEEAVDEVCGVLDAVLRGSVALGQAAEATHGWPVEAALTRWIEVVFGPRHAREVRDAGETPERLPGLVASLRSPWQLDESLLGNRFDWARLTEPIPRGSFSTAQEFRERFTEFMERDHLWAAQGNLDNPVKAAADGVWRDLRPVLAHAVDDAGLTADSHRLFLHRYMRHHNKLANGAAREVMEKILAIVRHGLLDVGAGPEAQVDVDPATGLFTVTGPSTGFRRQAGTLADARVHAFDPRTDVRPLYRNLTDRGLVRLWRNTSADGSSFEPGGLDLTYAFHPVRADGAADERITVLGPPSEGVMFFQLGALRPGQDHHVMRDVLMWLRGFRQRLRARTACAEPLAESMAGSRAESLAESEGVLS